MVRTNWLWHEVRESVGASEIERGPVWMIMSQV
jgi:hypothetical protein